MLAIAHFMVTWFAFFKRTSKVSRHQKWNFNLLNSLIVLRYLIFIPHFKLLPSRNSNVCFANARLTKAISFVIVDFPTSFLDTQSQSVIGSKEFACHRTFFVGHMICFVRLFKRTSKVSCHQKWNFNLLNSLIALGCLIFRSGH